mgnify:FL=1
MALKQIMTNKMLKEKLKSWNLILASNSPRRQNLLRQLGVQFKVNVKPVEEIFPEKLSGHQISDYLSLLKANEFNDDLRPNDLLITSDTIVWHHNNPLGKPTSLKHAVEMLQSLSESTHEVITSVCFTSKKKQKIFNDSTKVTFHKIKNDEIEFYINNFNPLDKAGAYGIQDWIGQIGIKKIEGSFFNVMGFPLHLVYKNLLEF